MHHVCLLCMLSIGPLDICNKHGHPTPSCSFILLQRMPPWPTKHQKQLSTLPNHGPAAPHPRTAPTLETGVPTHPVLLCMLLWTATSWQKAFLSSPSSLVGSKSSSCNAVSSRATISASAMDMKRGSATPLRLSSRMACSNAGAAGIPAGRSRLGGAMRETCACQGPCSG